MSASHLIAVLVLAGALQAARADGQVISQRGFAEARVQLFPDRTPNDSTRAVGDVLLREELFAKPIAWLQFAVGADLRLNSHEQVEDEWRVDVSDRGIRRPRLSLRRATATIAFRKLTLDVGKQFIRWGKADIVNPTDHFAPRDYLNVVDTEFLPVTGGRAALQATAQDSLELVWLPRFTPSRIPLLDQRWTALPPDAPLVQIVDAGAVLPTKSQRGLRWSHVGDRVEYSLSFFDGVNHLPNIDQSLKPNPLLPEIDILKRYPTIRSYGADLAMPTPWLTVKGEVAYFTSRSSSTDEYVLYVVQVERQTGEWVLVGGYAGEAVTNQRAQLTFAPDRGLTKSLVARASYTIDPNRSLALETAVRQNLAGAYGKAEYSQAYGQHWRATLAGVVIGGGQDDFLGQYRQNSHLSITLRCSY
ncbi:MAG: hypothetical protein ABJA98_07285 [Acidobacteriota bacterium]